MNSTLSFVVRAEHSSEPTITTPLLMLVLTISKLIIPGGARVHAWGTMNHVIHYGPYGMMDILFLRLPGSAQFISVMPHSIRVMSVL